MTDAGPQNAPTEAPLTFMDNPMNPLEQLLYAGLADARRMSEFERIMLEADLYAVPEPGAPGGVDGDDGAKVLKPGEQLVLRGVYLNDGRDTVTLFTDPRRAQPVFGEDTRIIAMNGRLLLSMLRDKVVLLNPDGGKGLLLEPDQIKAILQLAPDRPPVRPSGPVELAEPGALQQPGALIGRLMGAFQTQKIDAAWLACARWTETGQAGWFLDVRTDVPADQITALCERAVAGMTFGDEVFDISVARPGGEKGVGVKLV